MMKNKDQLRFQLKYHIWHDLRCQIMKKLKGHIGYQILNQRVTEQLMYQLLDSLEDQLCDDEK
jgi:hypothetical protein